MAQWNLKLVLLDFQGVDRWSRVDGGVPRLAAAPSGPETRASLGQRRLDNPTFTRTVDGCRRFNPRRSTGKNGHAAAIFG
jgi:hypothetical protein